MTAIMPVVAQERVPDQNPRYMESYLHYAPLADSLNAFHATTLQQTYKAYNYFEAKAERKAQRREWRQQRRLQNIRYSPSWQYTSPWGYDDYYYYRPYRRTASMFTSYLTATALAFGIYSLWR
ncbi:hypothetical protein [Chitinophaga solisilvae]|nr:hypothetical protein [Chitinophaga solisilvae]